MERSYTHARTLVVAVVCILAVAGAFVYTRVGNQRMATSRNLTVSNKDATPEQAPVSDESWKRAFLDSSSTPRLGSTPTKSPEALTITDKLGRDFFARYIQLKQGGFLDNQELVQSALEQSIDSAASEAHKPPLLTIKNILVTSDASAQSVRVYANTTGRIFSDFGSDDDAATIANTAFEKSDMNLLTRIDPIIVSYEKISGALKATPVPQPLAEYHLALTNAINTMASLSKDIRSADKDPMRAIVALNTYSQTQKEVVSAIQHIKNYLSISGLSFSPDEPGILFTLSI